MTRLAIKMMLVLCLTGIVTILVSSGLYKIVTGGEWKGMVVLNGYIQRMTDGVIPNAALVDTNYRLSPIVIPDYLSPISLSWLPDGKNLIFTAIRGNRRDLYSLQLETGRMYPLTFDDNFTDSISVSPDGSMIAYTAEIRKSSVSNPMFYIRILNVEDRQIRTLGEPSLDPLYLTGWSSDGTRIAFSVSLSTTLFYIDIITGEIRQLTNTLYLENPYLTLSPDWKTILYINREPAYQASIYKSTVLSGEVTRLTDPVNILSPFSPAFSSDGSKIAFIESQGLYWMNNDGTDQTLLVKFQNIRAFRWSNTGDEIYFTDGNEVFSINLKDKTYSQVVSHISERIFDFQIRPS